jgi:hypothetical protein
VARASTTCRSRAAILVALVLFLGARTAYLEVVEIGAGAAPVNLRLNVPEP